MAVVAVWMVVEQTPSQTVLYLCVCCFRVSVVELVGLLVECLLGASRRGLGEVLSIFC